MNRRCPSCGKTEEKQEFVKNFCPECFASCFPLADIPILVEVTRCTVCGRIKSGFEWVNENKQVLTAIIAAKIKSLYSPVVSEVVLRERRSGFDTRFNVDFTVDDKIIGKKCFIRIEFMQTQCVDCSRDTGGYYDTIVQLRSNKEREVPFDGFESKVKKVTKLVEQRGGRVMKVEEVENGFDLYVGGITPAMQASHAVGEKVKHTRKLIGRKKGKDLYRHTFCVRF